MQYIFIFILCFNQLLALELNESGLGVVLEGNNGGFIKGGVWNSNILKGKVTLFFYVDPDSLESNEAFAKKVKAEHFDLNAFQSVAVVSLDSWIPNFLIQNRIKSRQKEFPHVTYLEDKKRFFLKKWGFKKDSTDVFIFNKKGNLIFKKFGKLDKKEIEEALNLIKRELIR